MRGASGPPCFFPAEPQPVLAPRCSPQAEAQGAISAGPRCRLPAALGSPRCPQLSFPPAPGTRRHGLPAPHSCPDTRLQLLRGVPVTEVIWVAGLSCGTLGRGQSKPHPSRLIFVPRENRGDLPRAAELPQSSPGELVLSEATRAAFLHPWFWWEMERCRAVSQASRKVSQCRRERCCSQEAPAHRAKAVSSHPAPGTNALGVLHEDGATCPVALTQG